jgi:cytochrome d ubiquinol oxidase subunit I
MSLDPVILARAQFGFTIAFHILFPAFTIGLASYLAVLEGLWLATGRETFHTLYRFWIKIFAVSFGMGVVSGIVISFEFGTNWSRLSKIAGPVIGPLMSYEVLTAFFLEAGFLGIMLFGWERVGRRLHFFATLMVALGTILSMFWILAANSWMQTPAGYVMRGGQFVPADWWRVVFSPSFPYRLVHMALAAYLTTGTAVAGIAAWYLSRNRASHEARTMFGMAIGLIAVVAPLQILAGDMSGLEVRDNQPAKLAAMEGDWDTTDHASMILFAWPDEAEERNLYELAIPKIGSLILTHRWNGEVEGLKSFAPDLRPPVFVVFWAFRIMVGLALLMLAIGWGGAVLAWRRRLFRSRWFRLVCMAATPAGFLAVLAGWVTTEVGRQPFVVYGLLRTAEASSPIRAEGVAASLVLFVAAYGLIFSAGTYYILRLIGHGPEAAGAPGRGLKTASRPLSLPDERIEANTTEEGR